MGQRMCVVLALPILLLASTDVVAQSARDASDTGSGHSTWLDHYREPAARLIGETLSSPFAWQRLSVLTDTIGHRLSGTPALDRAIQWALAEMKRDGLENVHGERVMVPRWVR